VSLRSRQVGGGSRSFGTPQPTPRGKVNTPKGVILHLYPKFSFFYTRGLIKNNNFIHTPHMTDSRPRVGFSFLRVKYGSLLDIRDYNRLE
jgi:hypothetical protein